MSGILSVLSPTSLELAGVGLLIVLAGLLFWAVYRAGAARAKRRMAEEGNEHAREALAVDERVHGAPDAELERLYDESLD